jgi:NitT/TauT family transport system ATP-binding protein
MLKLNNINFAYEPKKDHNNLILKDFNLDIIEGELLSLVGPSGCGKTTLVNIIAGYLKPTSGDISVDGKIVEFPGKDRIVINQEDDLFAWMTVMDNMKIISKNDLLIKKYLDLTNLFDYANYYPGQLSGGMKKRLSLARALLADAKFIIMDEPFASLDHKTRDKLQEEVLKIIKESGKTVLLVTHNVDEAIFMSDRVLFISSKPINVVREFQIPISYPRDIDVKESKEFNVLKHDLKNIIKNT